MGREIAARATPTGVLANFSAGRGLVQDHRWRDQLDAMRTELKKRLNARLGKELIREICSGLAHAGALPDRGARHLQTPGRQFHDRARNQAGRGLAAIREQDPAHLHCASKLGPELQDAFPGAGSPRAHRASQGSFA